MSSLTIRDHKGKFGGPVFEHSADIRMTQPAIHPELPDLLKIFHRPNPMELGIGLQILK